MAATVCQQENRDQDKIHPVALVTAIIILIPTGYGGDVQYKPVVACFTDEAHKQIITGLISALANQETLVTLEQSIRKTEDEINTSQCWAETEIHHCSPGK